jgi:Glyoxalase-like domain
MPTRLSQVVLDATDHRALARWWADALGWAVTLDDPREAEVAPPGPDRLGLPLGFGPVPEAKAGKNRVHLDLRSASTDDQAALVARLTAAGARPVDVGQGDQFPWTVLADPEGNEFCVLTPR